MSSDFGHSDWSNPQTPFFSFSLTPGCVNRLENPKIIHWRSYLMRHIDQKGRLKRLTLFCFPFGHLQFVLLLIKRLTILPPLGHGIESPRAMPPMGRKHRHSIPGTTTQNQSGWCPKNRQILKYSSTRQLQKIRNPQNEIWDKGSAYRTFKTVE